MDATDTLLSDALNALQAGDYVTVRHLVKTTNVDVCKGMVVRVSPHQGPGGPSRRVRERRLPTTSLFYVACKIGYESFWLERELVEAVIDMIESGRVQNIDPVAYASDTSQFNLAWHCIPVVCNKVLRVMGLHRMLPMFAVFPRPTNTTLVRSLQVRLARRTKALQVRPHRFVFVTQCLECVELVSGRARRVSILLSRSSP